ncbi:MAG: hypothetical protein NTZ16_02485 [Verrucomicrobia bacterium]|nr:hypothetical protein [Verrucomicrobiota bacterium]
MAERLLAIDVFAGADCRHGNHRVRVVRRGDHHGVNVLLLLQHLAVVGVKLRLGITRDDRRGVGGVNVAQGHDVFTFEIAQVVFAHPADADAGDVQLLARRFLARTRDQPARQNEQ